MKRDVKILREALQAATVVLLELKETMLQHVLQLDT